MAKLYDSHRDYSIDINQTPEKQFHTTEDLKSYGDRIV